MKLKIFSILAVIILCIAVCFALSACGETPGDDTPGGDTPGGETPGGETPGDDTPGGETPGGETPGGDTPGTGETPGGETPGGETPGGETPGNGEALGDCSIASASMTLTGTSLSAMVSNTTTEFSFYEDITVAPGASYVVARDRYCENLIHAKLAPLAYGDNEFYILVTRENEMQLYTVTIRRLPLYTVEFETYGGTGITSQSVEEGSLAEKPSDPTRDGYTFTGWNFDFSTPVTENKTVNSQWSACTNTPYKVEYYLQNLQRNGYDLELTENLSGTTDTKATATVKTFEHFTHYSYASGTKLSGKISGDGSLVLKVYYTRNSYTVNVNNTSGGKVAGAGTYTYGTTVSLTATPYVGYDFLGWYNGETRISDKTTYTEIISENLTAKFEVWAELAAFNFTATETTCTITGLKDKNISSVVVPDCVTSIGSSAFKDCTSLTSITLPFVGATKNGTSNTHFGYIFGASSYDRNSYYVPSRLKTVIITGGTSIGSSAFEDCTSLESVTIGNSVKSIGSSAFYGCTSLEEIYFNAATMSDFSSGNYVFANAGKNGNGIKVIIGKNVTKIPAYIFYPYSYSTSYSPKITSVEFEEGSVCKSIGSYAFNNCDTLTSVTISNSVESIDTFAFYDCDSLTSITIPDSVTSIGSGAFSYCSSLASVTIPDGVESIGGSAFSDCPSLNCNEYNNAYYLGNDSNPYIVLVKAKNTRFTSCKINEKTKAISDDAFYNRTTLESITIPDSVTSIGSSAFRGCTSLASVTIPDGVESIGGSAFSHCSSLESISVSEQNPNYKSIDGNLYTKDEKTIVQYAIGKKAASFTIPDSVESIGSHAFGNCTSLKSVTIPDSVTSIGDYAFYFCTNLESVTIGNSVASIGDEAFYKCTSLVSITIPDSVESISYYAFGYCTSLVSITIGNSVTSIGSYAFSGCTSLTSVTIPDSVTSIGSDAFYKCTSLASIEIPDSVESIGYSAFDNCTSLESVYYCGTASEWNQISIYDDNDYLTTAKRYYYSATQPTKSGNYWYYDNGVIKIWE